MTWQPIDTAPKDGTWILVWGGKTDEDYEWEVEPCRRRPVVAQWKVKHWRFASYDSGFYGYFDGADSQPTHWQPLPPLPDHPSLPEEAQQ